MPTKAELRRKWALLERARGKQPTLGLELKVALKQHEIEHKLLKMK